MSACLITRWRYTRKLITHCRGTNTFIRAFNLMLYVELLLKRTNGSFQCGLAPQNIPRECSCPSRVRPVFVHPGVAGNVPLLPCEVLVLGVIRVSSLTKRLSDCLPVWFHKHRIPFLFRIMRPLDSFQAEPTHCCMTTIF